MLNKKWIVVFPVLLVLFCCTASAQVYGHYYYTNDNGDTIRTIIDTTKGFSDFLPGRGCYCLPPSMFKFDKDGRYLLPDDHPSAKYFNDPKHFYWQNVGDDPRYGGYWEVKPEYMDSIQWDDGSWLKAAFWTIERWKRELEEEKHWQQQLPQWDEDWFKHLRKLMDELERNTEPGKGVL